jgi:hypothetical protein
LHSALTARIPYLPGFDFAAQCAPDELRKAELLAPGFRSQAFLCLSRQPERYGYTVLGQFRSGHYAICIIVSYTMSRRISLLFGVN